MAKLVITLGNKTYSSWSLRGWLPLVQTGAAFEEIVVPLRQSETHERILESSPSGKVPSLSVTEDGETLLIWDSLAIAEWLAERFPGAGLWPDDAAARAHARSVAAEMHAGFQALRQNLPMDLSGRLWDRGPTLRRAPGVAEDIARIVAIWEDCRTRFGQPARGDFLFGDFTIADAAYLPVAARFRTYGVPLFGPAERYLEAALAWPAMRTWTEDALDEPWVIDFPELEDPAPG